MMPRSAQPSGLYKNEARYLADRTSRKDTTTRCPIRYATDGLLLYEVQTDHTHQHVLCSLFKGCKAHVGLKLSSHHSFPCHETFKIKTYEVLPPNNKSYLILLSKYILMIEVDWIKLTERFSYKYARRLICAQCPRWYAYAAD